MAFGKNVGLKSLTYRGGGPMWSWLLHRISGLGIVIFVSLHVIASFFTHVVPEGGDIGTWINGIYESWPFQVFVYFCVIFHALNGFRIIMMDLWPQFLQYQREVIWAEWIIFFAVYGMVLYFMIGHIFSGA